MTEPMALKDLIITRNERIALDIVRPVWDDLSSWQLEKLMADIIAVIQAERKRK